MNGMLALYGIFEIVNEMAVPLLEKKLLLFVGELVFSLFLVGYM